jgi:hypothetical protein
MRDARISEMHAYERHAYEMAYGRGMPMECMPTVRDMPMR